MSKKERIWMFIILAILAVITVIDRSRNGLILTAAIVGLVIISRVVCKVPLSSTPLIKAVPLKTNIVVFIIVMGIHYVIMRLFNPTAAMIVLLSCLTLFNIIVFRKQKRLSEQKKKIPTQWVKS